MRRIVSICALVLVSLSGLLLLLRISPPRASRPEPRPEQDLAPSVGDVAPAPAEAPVEEIADREDLRGRLWRLGGAPIPDMEVRLLGGDGGPVTTTRTGADGRFRIDAATVESAGDVARLLVNPEPGDPWFVSFTMEVAERKELDLYVPGVPRREHFHLEVHIDGAVPKPDGGGPVWIRLLTDDGGGAHWPLDPDRPTLVLEDQRVGTYAFLARQGDRSGYVPLQRLTSEAGPLVLALDRATSVRGRVLSPDGGPAAEAEVRLVFDPAPHRRLTDSHVLDVNEGTRLVTHQARTDIDGRFRFEGLAAVPHHLAVIHDTGSLRTEVAAGAPGEEIDLADLRLSPDRGAIRIEFPAEILEARGEGDLRLMVLGYHHRTRRQLTLEPGKTAIAANDLPPDSYAVAIVHSKSVPGGRFRQFLSIVEVVDVPPGDPIELRLRPQP